MLCAGWGWSAVLPAARFASPRAVLQHLPAALAQQQELTEEHPVTSVLCVKIYCLQAGAISGNPMLQNGSQAGGLDLIDPLSVLLSGNKPSFCLQLLLAELVVIQ